MNNRIKNAIRKTDNLFQQGINDPKQEKPRDK